MFHSAVFLFLVTSLLDVGLTLCTSDVVTFDDVGHVTVLVPEEYTHGVFNVSVKLSLSEPFVDQGFDLDLAESLEVTKAKLKRRQPLQFLLKFPGSMPDVTEVKVNEKIVCTTQFDAAHNRLRSRSARSTLEVRKAIVPTENDVKNLDNDSIVFPGMTNKHSSRNFGVRQNFRQNFNKCPWSSDGDAENDCSDLFWVDTTGSGALRVPVPSQRKPESAVHTTAYFIAAGSLMEQDVRAAGLQLDEPLAVVLSRLRAGANDIRYTVQLPARALCVQLISLQVNGFQVCNKNNAVPQSTYTNFSLWHQVYHKTPANIPPPQPNVPTERPSIWPVKPNVPTERPSIWPANQPSPNIPTERPSIWPAYQPSPNIASERPSIWPANQPSPNIPTERPSIWPANQPSPNIPTERPIIRPPVTPPPPVLPEPEEIKPVHVQLHLVFRSSQALQSWLSKVFGVDLNLAGRQSSNTVRVLKLSAGKA